MVDRIVAARGVLGIAFGVWLGISAGVALSGAADAQARHRIVRTGGSFALEEIATQRSRPFDMWVVRLANAAFDSAFTDEVIANLDDYKRYGLNTIVVGLQGGNIGSGSYPRVYNPDGTLDMTSPVWANMLRLLDETDRRGIVLCAQFWYFRQDENVPTDAAALIATRNAAQWFLNTGYEHYVYDIANEYLHGGYSGRPLFTTLNGALQLIDAIRSVEPGALIGISPPTKCFAPSGTLSSPTRQVDVDYIIAHNGVQDPNNSGAYHLSTKPANPSNYPYVNNEFWSQIPYERTRRTNPRTNVLDYGHFSPSNVADYLADLRKLVGYGGTGNVHARRLQHIPQGASRPIAIVGPAGTQPEASPGAGEPSLHWVFHGIAQIRGFGPIPNAVDFNGDYAPGIETDLGGTWTTSGGYFRQTDANAATAFARLVAEDGDVEVSVDCGFDSTPGANSAVGFQLGAASPAGPAWRLRAYRDRVELDRLGAPFTAQTVFRGKLFQDAYALRVRDGRVQVRVGGALVIDVADDGAITDHNVLLLTEAAAGRFDNVRVTPMRITDFEDSTTGPWSPRNAAAWDVRSHGLDRAWRASVGSGDERAHLGERLADLRLSCVVDLSGVGRLDVVFRSTDATASTLDGYRLDVRGDGSLTLERRDASGASVLATANAPAINPAAVAIDVTVEGGRIVARIDGSVVLDAIDPLPLDRGDVVFVAHPGTTWFDDIDLQVGPSRMPIARITAPPGAPIQRDFALEIGDPDGILDVATFQFAADGGGGFVDVTWWLLPWFAVFRNSFTPDGRSLLFELNVPAPVSGVDWMLRLRTTDRAGNTTTAYHRVRVP